MNAWIVSREHIDLLVRGLAESGIATGDEPDAIGRILWRENLRSVAYCRPDDVDGGRPNAGGFRDQHVDEYVYRRPTGPMDRDVLLKQAECYDSQSRQHPAYVVSIARAWVRELIERLSAAGHDSSSEAIPWGWHWTTASLPRILRRP